MASESVLELTNDNFEEQVLNADQPVLVDFWAEWCMPCRMLAPVIDSLASKYEGKAKIGKLDTEAARDVAVKYNISSIPTVILFKNGKPAKTMVGMQPESAYASEIDELIG